MSPVCLMDYSMSLLLTEVKVLSFLKSNETKREENQKSTQIKYRFFTFVAESTDLRCL